MYQLVGNSTKAVSLSAPAGKTPKTGQNRDILYISLAIGIIALLIGLYIFYKMHQKKQSESFGYKL